VQTIRQLVLLRSALVELRASGATIALVPTMGALHAGHAALVDEARRAADRVVVSIFVNPLQFAPHEDLDRYPRRESADARMLDDLGCDILWMPAAEDMYGAGFTSRISVGGIADELEGAARPGHFDGVATVVAKLFNQVRPDIAVFGEKDYQQLAIIRQMIADLDLDLTIRAVPTQRDDDGLALSSRNAYLSEWERARAVALPRALGDAARAIGRGQQIEAVLAAARDALGTAGFEPVDYVALRDAESLHPPGPGTTTLRLLAAAWMGRTRLIDNIAVEIPPPA